MSARTPDPARVFVRGMGLTEGLEWGFWLAATVWWVVVLDLSPLQLVGMGAVLEVTVLLAETPTGVVADMVSRRRSIMIGQIVMGAAYVWAVVSFDYWMILPAQALFGVGWGLSGFCPGPALAALSTGLLPAIVFCGAMLGGMVLHGLVFRD